MRYNLLPKIVSEVGDNQGEISGRKVVNGHEWKKKKKKKYAYIIIQ